MEQEVGRITHYFGKIGVAIIELTNNLEVGDKIRIKGHTSDWEQSVDSMQSEHHSIEKAVKGDVIGVNSKDHAREGDTVYVVKN